MIGGGYRRAFGWAVILTLIATHRSCDAQNPDSFNPGASGYPDTLALLPDGSLLVGGSRVLAGAECLGFGRLWADGSYDGWFRPPAGIAYSISVQEDGRIVYASSSRVVVSGDRFTPIFRISGDGAQDLSFSPTVRRDGGSSYAAVWAQALQPDGKILLGGTFDWVGGYFRTNLARLNSNGSTDLDFNPNSAVGDPRFGGVYCLALQPDGKIIVGGAFTNIAHTARNCLARLHPDGTIDSSFTPDASGPVYCLLTQPDGKVVVGGSFMYLGSQLSLGLGRLNPDGSIDASFLRDESWVSTSTLALQSNGDIVVGGDFTLLNGQVCRSIGRVHSDGVPDSSFAPSASYWVRCLALQSDGRILLSGNFTNVSGLERQNIARLSNNIPATSRLTCDGSTITWLRGGSSPEVWRTSFAFSTNGVNWVDLGAGTRISDGWTSGNVSLPNQATVRARGFVQSAGGHMGGSSCWYVEATTQFARPSIEIDPAIATCCTTGLCVVLRGFPGMVAVVEVSEDLTNWTPMTTNLLDSDPLCVCDSMATNASVRFYRAVTP